MIEFSDIPHMVWDSSYPARPKSHKAYPTHSGIKYAMGSMSESKYYPKVIAKMGELMAAGYTVQGEHRVVNELPSPGEPYDVFGFKAWTREEYEKACEHQRTVQA